MVAWRSRSVRERLELSVVKAVGALPAPAQLALAGGQPIRVDGQLLEPEVQLTLRLLEVSRRPPFEALPVERARAEIRAEAALFAGAPLALERVEELSIPGRAGTVGARLYVPHTAPDRSALLVYFHGGGFVVGDLDSHDATCRFLAREAGVRVLSVHYRRAPSTVSQQRSRTAPRRCGSRPMRPRASAPTRRVSPSAGTARAATSRR